MTVMSMPDPILYLANKTKPLAKVADDGTFVLTLLAYHPVRKHCKDAWRLLWAGQSAQEFWQNHSADLVPGVQIIPSVELVRPFDAAGRQCGAEIHAAVSAIKIIPIKGAQCQLSP